MTQEQPKKSARRRSRELVVQGLYQWQLCGHEPSQIELNLREETADFGKCDSGLFKSLLTGTIAHAAELQQSIEPFVDRAYAEISPVEKAILMLATYEFVHNPDVPYRVVINEAIELAKTFGGTDGHKYVNGVLDKLALRLRGTEVEAARQQRRPEN